MQRNSNFRSRPYQNQAYRDRSRQRDSNERYHLDRRKNLHEDTRRRPYAGHSKKHRGEKKTHRDSSSDEDKKAEKQKTADLVKNKLSALSAEDKSNSMKELLGNERKDGDDSSEKEKESKRIAHTRKPIPERQPKLNPVPPPPMPPLGLFDQLDIPQEDDQAKVQKNIKRKLLQDLVKMPICELKDMAGRPRAQDNLFLSHLLKETRSHLSDQFRRFAEQRLDERDSPQMISELERLVDPDIVADMSRLPPETIQTLSDIFSMNLDGDMTPPVPPPSAPIIEYKPVNIAAFDGQGQLYDPSCPTADDEDEGAVEPSTTPRYSWHQPQVMSPLDGIQTNASFLAAPSLGMPTFLNPPKIPLTLQMGQDSTETPVETIPDQLESVPLPATAAVDSINNTVSHIQKAIEEAKSKLALEKKKKRDHRSKHSIKREQKKIDLDKARLASPQPTKPLSLSEKLKVLQDSKKEKPITRGAGTQTNHIIFLNRGSQCIVPTFNTCTTQTMKLFMANSSTQTANREMSRDISSQTDPTIDIVRMPSEHAAIQTDGLQFGESMSTQTEVGTVEQGVQHVAHTSTRGEQVNRSFFSANKYSQTSSSTASKVPDKSSRSFEKEKKRDKEDVKVKKERDEPTPIPKMEGSALFVEFKKLQSDFEAMSVISPIRAKLVKHLLPVLTNSFSHVYSLFCDLVNPPIAAANITASAAEQTKTNSHSQNAKILSKERQPRKRERSSSSESVRSSRSDMTKVKKNARESFNSEKPKSASTALKPKDKPKVKPNPRSRSSSKKRGRSSSSDSVRSISSEVSKQKKKSSAIKRPRSRSKSNDSMGKGVTSNQRRARSKSKSEDRKPKPLVLPVGKKDIQVPDSKSKPKIMTDFEKKLNLLKAEKKRQRSPSVSSDASGEPKKPKVLKADSSKLIINTVPPKTIAPKETMESKLKASPRKKKFQSAKRIEEDRKKAEAEKAGLVSKTEENGVTPLPSEPPHDVAWYKRLYNIRECCVKLTRWNKPPSAPPTPTFDFDAEQPAAVSAPVRRESGNWSEDSHSQCTLEKPPTPTPIEEESNFTGTRDVKSACKTNSTLSDNGDGSQTSKKLVWTKMELRGHEGDIVDFKISGGHLLAASDDEAVHCYNLKNGKRKRKYNTTAVQCIAVVASGKGEILLCGGHDKIIRAFSVQTSKLIKSSIVLDSVPQCMDPAHQDKNFHLYVGLDCGTCLSLDPKTLKIANKSKISDSPVLCILAMNLNNESSHVVSTADKKLSLRNFHKDDVYDFGWKYEQPVEKMLYKDGGLYCTSQSPYLVYFTFSNDSGWSPPQEVYTESNTIGLCLSQNFLFIGSQGGTVVVYNTEEKRPVSEFTLEKQLRAIGISHKKLIIGVFEGGRIVANPLPAQIAKLLAGTRQST